MGALWIRSLIKTHVKAISELQLLSISWLHKETLPAPSGQTRHAWSQQPSNQEVCRCCDGERQADEVHEDEDQHYAQRLAEAVGIGEAPGERGEDQEEGEQVGEGRIGAVPSVLGLCKCASAGLTG